MQNIQEIYRLINNIVRFGTIAEIDHELAAVRVQTGDNLTDWLPWLTPRAAQVQTWCPPRLNEQVVLFSPGGDLNQGIAVTALYSNENPAPKNTGDVSYTEYPDGTSTEYNHAENILTIQINGEANINITGNLTATVQGNLTATVEGDATANVEGKLAATAGDEATIDAPQIKLNNGTGVVTGAHICAYTGSPHSHCSSTVKAGT